MRIWLSRSLSRMSPALPERSARAAWPTGSPEGTRFASDSWARMCSTALSTSLDYDIVKDFEPIALLASNPQLIVARKDLPGRNLKGPCRVAEGKSRQGHAGIGGPGQSCTCQRGLFPHDHRHRISICTVPRSGSGDAGPGGWPRRSHVRSAAELVAECARRSDQGIRGDRQGATSFRAGRSQRGRGRPAGILYLHLVRHVGAQGHPQEIVAKLNLAVVDALAHETVQRRLADLGQEVPPRPADRLRRLPDIKLRKSRSGGRSSKSMN